MTLDSTTQSFGRHNIYSKAMWLDLNEVPTMDDFKLVKAILELWDVEEEVAHGDLSNGGNRGGRREVR